MMKNKTEQEEENNVKSMKRKRRPTQKMKNNEYLKTKPTKKSKTIKKTKKQTIKNDEDIQKTHKWIVQGNKYRGFAYDKDSERFEARDCYPCITRETDDDHTVDVVMVRDCVSIKTAEGGGNFSSYPALVTAIWVRDVTKEIMLSIIWYYRREHVVETDSRVNLELCADDESYCMGGTGNGFVDSAESKKKQDSVVYLFKNELCSSLHHDAQEVDTIERRCHVLSYPHYCRVRALLRRRNTRFVTTLPRRVYDVHRIVATRAPSGANCQVFYQRPNILGETPFFDREDSDDDEESAEDRLYFVRSFYDVNREKICKKLPDVAAHTKRHMAPLLAKPPPAPASR